MKQFFRAILAKKARIYSFLRYNRFDLFFFLFLSFYFVFCVYLFTNFTLNSFDLESYRVEASSIENRENLGKGLLPERILIKKNNLDMEVLNPESPEISVLNEALKFGIIRYPESGFLGEGNVLLLGHSSFLRTVRNPAYKAFNNLEKLEENDEIIVFGGEKKYIYKVISVSKIKSNEAKIPFDTDLATLTISTCNVLGKEEERIVVIATLAEEM